MKKLNPIISDTNASISSRAPPTVLPANPPRIVDIVLIFQSTSSGETWNNLAVPVNPSIAPSAIPTASPIPAVLAATAALPVTNTVSLVKKALSLLVPALSNLGNIASALHFLNIAVLILLPVFFINLSLTKFKNLVIISLTSLVPEEMILVIPFSVPSFANLLISLVKIFVAFLFTFLL